MMSFFLRLALGGALDELAHRLETELVLGFNPILDGRPIFPPAFVMRTIVAAREVAIVTGENVDVGDGREFLFSSIRSPLSFRLRRFFRASILEECVKVEILTGVEEEKVTADTD